jgi:uncharacterized delta-60 repeat protein
VLHVFRTRSATPSRRKRPANRIRPRLEALEGRALLAGWPWVPQLPAGSLDPTFGSGGRVVSGLGVGANSAVDVAVHSDGAVVTLVDSYNGQHAGSWYLTRLTTSGQLDATFHGPTGSWFTYGLSTGDDATKVAIEPDGKLVIGGWSGDPAAGRQFPFVERTNADGSLDPTFAFAGSPVLDSVSGLAFSGTRIVVTGEGTGSYSGQFVVLRLNADGSLDPTFGAGGVAAASLGSGLSGNASAVAVAPDGTIVLGGTGQPGTGQTRTAVATFSPGGVLTHLALGPGNTAIEGSIRSVAVQPDGKVVAAGWFLDTGDTGPFAAGYLVARYTASLGVDTSFGTNGQVLGKIPGDNAGAVDVAIQRDGKIVVGTGAAAVVRLDPDGAFDPTFGKGGTAVVSLTSGTQGGVNATALGPDGNIVLAGPAVNPGASDTQVTLARLLGTAIEGPTPVVVAQGLTVKAPAGTWFAHQVVTFQVTNLLPGAAAIPAPAFRAWVNWGDGTFSAGHVKLTPDGTYQVVASHRYKKAGIYRTTSQILAWPPGIVLSEVQGKVVAGGKLRA